MNRSTFFYALLHPINLSMLALAAAAGACAAWWLFPLGVVFWLLMMVITIRDPRLGMILLPKSRKPQAQRFQDQFSRLEQARVSVFNALGSANAPVRRILSPAQKKMDDLVNQAYQVFQQMSALENRRLVNQMNARSNNKLPQNDQALEEKRQAQISSLASVLDQADAQFANLAVSVDGIVTHFVSLQAVSSDQAKQELPHLLELIQTEIDGLAKFAQDVNI